MYPALPSPGLPGAILCEYLRRVFSPDFALTSPLWLISCTVYFESAISMLIMNFIGVYLQIFRKMISA